MKKLFATVLTLMLVFGLVSCGRNNPAAMKPVLLPVPELPEVTPVPEPMSYEEYFSYEREYVPYWRSDIVKVRGFRYGRAYSVDGDTMLNWDDPLCSDPKTKQYLFKVGVEGVLVDSPCFAFVEVHDGVFYVINDNELYKYDEKDESHSLIYKGRRSVTNLDSDGTVLFFLDGPTVCRVYLPTMTIDELFSDSKLGTKSNYYYFIYIISSHDVYYEHDIYTTAESIYLHTTDSNGIYIHTPNGFPPPPIHKAYVYSSFTQKIYTLTWVDFVIGTDEGQRYFNQYLDRRADDLAEIGVASSTVSDREIPNEPYTSPWV